MAQGGAYQNSNTLQDPGAALRMGKLASARKAMGKTGRRAALGLSLASAAPQMPPQAPDGVRQDPVAAFQAARHINQRQLSANAVAPQLQSLSQTLQNDGDEEDLQAAESIDESFEDFAEQSAQADDMSQLSRIRSEIKSRKDDALREVTEKVKKEFERNLANLKTEGVAKSASTIDNGELLEIPDTIGTGVSTIHLIISFFKDSFSQKSKDRLTKLGLPPLEMHRAVDLGVIIGTEVQIIKWAFVVTILGPFCIIFIVMAVGTICDSTFFCSPVLGSGLSFVSWIKSTF